jgi:hypothetical protein
VPRIPPLAGRIAERDSLRLLPSKPALACASSQRTRHVRNSGERIFDSKLFAIQKGQLPIGKYEAGVRN